MKRRLELGRAGNQYPRVVASLLVLATGCGDESSGVGGGGGTTADSTSASTASSLQATSSATLSATGTAVATTVSQASTTVGSSSGTGQMLDLANGTWEVDPIGFGYPTSPLAHTDDGRTVAAFVGYGIQTAELQGGGFSITTQDPGEGFREPFEPALVASGNRLWLTWTNDRYGGERDVMMALANGGAFSPKVNVTSLSELQGVRDDIAPSIVSFASGGGALAYESSLPNGEDSQIRVLFLDAQGAPVGAPVVALQDPDGCWSPDLAVLPDDSLLVVATCGESLSTVMATGSPGTPFNVEPTPLGATLPRSVAVDSQGFVHIAWGRPDGRVRVIRGKEGVWGEVSSFNVVSSAPPQIAIDPWDRPVLAFDSRDEEAVGDLMVTFAPDGVTYVEPTVVTAASIDHYVFPGRPSFRKGDGGPELTFSSDSEVDGTQLFHVRFVPN